MLDAHFGVEQVTRYGKDVYFNFNGTAGIWRKAAIMDAGGWKADTLTEDTDLSYGNSSIALTFSVRAKFLRA